MARDDSRPEPEQPHTASADGADGPPGDTSEAAAGGAPGAADGEVPRGPTDLPRRSWWEVLKRTAAEYRSDNLSDLAAALTYYGVLAVFPAMLALVSVLGLVGSSAAGPLLDDLTGIAPGPARRIIDSMLRQVEQHQGQAGLALALGIVVALWSASGYVAAFMRASDTVYDIAEGRPIWKTLPLRFGLTLALVVLMAVSAVGVVFTGQLATRAGQRLGVGQTAVTVWDIVKWPVLVVLFSLMIALLYWAAPNVTVRPRFRWISPGSLLAVLIWLGASALFALYVANFGSYDRTYGSLAAVIVFLIWLWISNIAILLGLEFDAELARRRAVEAGGPPGQEPYVEPRDTRGLRPAHGGADEGADKRTGERTGGGTDGGARTDEGAHTDEGADKQTGGGTAGGARTGVGTDSGADADSPAEARTGGDDDGRGRDGRNGPGN